jgi:hypothetical protein
MSTNYNYTFSIIRPDGNILSLTISSCSDVKARLKAKTIAKTIGGTVSKLIKQIAPYKCKDDNLNKLQESMMSH